MTASRAATGATALAGRDGRATAAVRISSAITLAPARDPSRAGSRTRGGLRRTRLHAPPVPAQDVDETRTRAQSQKQLPDLADLVHEDRDDDREHEGDERRQAGDQNVVALGRLLAQKTPVEIIDEIARPPVH